MTLEMHRPRASCPLAPQAFCALAGCPFPALSCPPELVFSLEDFSPALSKPWLLGKPVFIVGGTSAEIPTHPPIHLGDPESRCREGPSALSVCGSGWVELFSGFGLKLFKVKAMVY